ncbi:hypothetical protein D3C81_1630780 [compost metagenome]
MDYVNQIEVDEKDFNKALSDLQDQFYYMLQILIYPLIFVFILLFLRYRWLLSAHAYLEDAHKMKESELKKQQESLMKINMWREKKLGTLIKE